MRRGREGFTVMELVIVIVVGLILTSLAVASFAPAQRLYAVKSAQRTFAALHARARAHAIESGSRTQLNVDVSADRVWITRQGQTVEKVDFREQFNVDVQATSAPVVMCMNPRGFGDTDCTSFVAETEVLFVLHDKQERVTLYPLGQLIVR